MRDSVRHLSKGVAIYGAGDAAIQIVNLLLMAVYVKGGFLGMEDYGALALIGGFEAITKIISRWGLDGAFMRFFHERPAGGPLELITSTIVWFTIGADVIVFAVLLAVSGWIAAHWFPNPTHVLAFRLMLVNTFLISLTFLPFHLMRLRNQAVTYSALTFGRSIGTLIVRIVLVIGLGWGLAGMYATDLAITLLLLPILWRWVRPLIQARFSPDDLRLVLRFGLPRLPHGLAQQALDAGNKMLLRWYIPLHELGVYGTGVTLGNGVRFFTSAFETVWAPFYYATSRRAEAPEVFAKMTTYGIAVLTLLVALTVAVARDLILVMFKPEWSDAARVMPLIAVGVALQGVYLLTSIGLNLTTRTQYYPVATFAALGVGIGSGLILMPRFGVTGAAIAFLASAVTQTSVAFFFSRRFYPIPYEVGRVLRVVASGIVAAMAGLWLIPQGRPIVGLFARAGVTTAVFVALIAATGFLRKTERAFAAEVWGSMRRKASGFRGA
ncbi:MAG TPA: lipopolysaccharide biosynthesis protein [Vicinamibacterales bacterium]|nr:lipopolysaccharide biosynthesis protein [Vicinamibacterales bacterium]